MLGWVCQKNKGACIGIGTMRRAADNITRQAGSRLNPQGKRNPGRPKQTWRLLDQEAKMIGWTWTQMREIYPEQQSGGEVLLPPYAPMGVTRIKSSQAFLDYPIV